MTTNKFLILALIAFTFFTSCQSDDDIVEIIEPEVVGQYTNGFFILNEGNFGSGNSTVSFLDENQGEITEDIFSRANDGAALGDVAQSIAFYEDLAFIIVNVSNKIEVVDRHTFELVATIDEGLQNPRFAAFADGNAYVTNWGDGTDPEDDYIAVINTRSFEIIESIPVPEGPEAIIAEAGKLYVAHLGGFSFNDVITVINSDNNELEETITVGDRPNSLEIANNSLWVLTGGLPNYAEEETAGKLVQIDLVTAEVVQEFTFPNATDHPGNLEVENSTLYYTLGKSVYSMNLAAEEIPETSMAELDEVASLYGFEVYNGLIYALSANLDFTGNGDLFIYDAGSGALENSFEVGVNPNGIYFNE